MRNRDIVIIEPRPVHLTNEVTKHIHEHRAPTDDSVRLLAEMEAKARDKIIEAIQVGDTTFQCVVHVQTRFDNDDVHLMAVFSLNGKNLTAEHVTRRIDFDRKKAFTALRDAIAIKIASEILTTALTRLDMMMLPKVGR